MKEADKYLLQEFIDYLNNNEVADIGSIQIELFLDWKYGKTNNKREFIKTIHLNVKEKWFDMIYNGEKKEEYREISPFYVSLFFDWRKSGLTRKEFAERLKKEKNKSELWHYFKLTGSYSFTFSNGYQPDRPQFSIDWLSVTIDEGKWRWGAEYGKCYFVIRLGDIYKTY